MRGSVIVRPIPQRIYAINNLYLGVRSMQINRLVRFAMMGGFGLNMESPVCANPAITNQEANTQQIAINAILAV